jgi:hypothetical protein
MSEKVKPWHQRKPKHGNKEHERPQRRRNPNTKDDNCDSYPRGDESMPNEYDPANYSERWES